ncbi:MAG: ChaN family lipoprotein [Armatimonadetes bacterium]|nr:ChaN family lipoprotein [Armatimonadota bacterium]
MLRQPIGWITLAPLLLGMVASRGLPAAGDEPPQGRCQLWVDVYRGEPLAYPDVLADLAGARVLYLGERHGVARIHRWQARIVADLARKGVPLALALEQIEAHQQPVVDRYNRGEIGFEELTRAIDWARRWPGYEDYRPAIEAARRAGAPILALNARQETVRQVARSGGVANLPPEARAELPADMDLDDPPYERVLGRPLQVHMAATPERLRPMVEAQIARDETMAERLAAFLKSEAGKSRMAVVLVGAGHVSYGLGLPERVRRRMPETRDRIVVFSESGEGELTPGMEAVSRPVMITHEDLRAIGRPIADYLQVAGRPDTP